MSLKTVTEGSGAQIPTFICEDFFRDGVPVHIHLSTVFPDYVGVVHKHTFIEIVYIVSGKAVHKVGDCEVKASKGDIFIVNYDLPHAFFAVEDADDPFVAYDLMITPRFLDAELLGAQNFEDLASSILFYSLFPEEYSFGSDLHVTGNHYHEFKSLFENIHLEYQLQRKGYVELIRAYVLELLIKILRKMGQGTATSSVTLKHKSVVDMTVKFLYEHYDQRVSIMELASRAFLSKDYFCRVFRDITGVTIKELLNRIRFEEACRLLSETERTVKDIAESCGFVDMKYFYSAFKEITGFTPSAYRSGRSQ